VVPDLGRGFISDGAQGKAIIFDLKTLKVVEEANAAPDADCIIYDPASHRVFTFNGDSHSATAIDPATGKKVGTIDLGGGHDGKWVTYVTYPDYALWRSRVDGSDALQLTFPPMSADLPRWSPDGTQIAFVDSELGKPFKIFLVSAQGGTPQELLPETHNQIDPAWSPDGKQLAFGRVGVVGSTEKLAIQVEDISTHKISIIPDSETCSVHSGHSMAGTSRHSPWIQRSWCCTTSRRESGRIGSMKQRRSDFLLGRGTVTTFTTTLFLPIIPVSGASRSDKLVQNSLST